MPTIISGTTKVSDINQAQLKLSMEDVAAELDPRSFIFETILRKIANGVRSVGRMNHQWRERRLLACTTVTTAVAAANATTITVANPALGRRDMLVACPATGEAFLMAEDVGGVAAAGKITVVNKAGTGGITTEIPAGSTLLFLIESHAEGEAIPPAWASQEEDFATYIQQFDETIQVTDIADNEETYGPKELAIQRRQKYIEFMRRFCLTLYHGNKFRETTTAGGARRHGMAGLVEYLSPRAINMSGVPGGFTMKTLGELIRPCKSHGASSMKKLMIAGQNAIAAINAFPENYVRTTPGEQSKWGVTVKELHTNFGDIDVVYDQLLSQEYGLADRAFIIDPNPDYIYMAQLQGLPMQVKTNIQDSTDIHNIKDVITGTRGLVLKLPELHQMITGING
jgi:hypothetical protein